MNKSKSTGQVFKIGDVVRLKTGGPSMVVNATYQKGINRTAVETRYYDSYQQRFVSVDKLDEATLEVYPPAIQPNTPGNVGVVGSGSGSAGSGAGNEAGIFGGEFISVR